VFSLYAIIIVVWISIGHLVHSTFLGIVVHIAVGKVVDILIALALELALA